jgi:nucleoside-diphosphate-sugar epimerase
MANRVLVVGHTGLIGTELMSHSSDVTLVPAKSRINLADPNQQFSIILEAINESCDAILCLAWQANSLSNYDDLSVHSSWLDSTYRLAELCVENRIKIYLIGTCLDSDPVSTNRYIQSKSLLKTKLTDEIFSGDVIWIRPFYIVSIDNMRPRIVQSIFSGSQVRSPSSSNDYIMVEDLASGLLVVLEKGLSGKIDIGSGFLTTNKELAEAIYSKCQSPPPSFGDFPKTKGVAANMSILSENGWEPKITLEFLKGTN